jgi:molybdenum cofactor cytidylyltransferase
VIAAIVLAAGDSTRMGTPKALLPDGQGRVFVTRLLHTFRGAGFRTVTLVTGSLHERLVAAVARGVPAGLTVQFARNPDPSSGQLSSLLRGLAAAAVPGTRAAMVTLVDVPFVSAGTIRALVSAWESTRAPIVRPAQGSRHGHPVIFDASLFAELRAADPAEGAKAVIRAHAPQIAHVDVEDSGAFVDVDTPEDYRRALCYD